MPELNIEYEGAQVTVNIEADHAPDHALDNASDAPSPVCHVARLYINALLRDQAKLTPATRSIRLSTSLQTDYEWHEHVESVITVNDSNMTVSLSANRHELARRSYRL